jgi:hypothetical protein
MRFATITPRTILSAPRRVFYEMNGDFMEGKCFRTYAATSLYVMMFSVGSSHVALWLIIVRLLVDNSQSKGYLMNFVFCRINRWILRPEYELDSEYTYISNHIIPIGS